MDSRGRGCGVHLGSWCFELKSTWSGQRLSPASAAAGTARDRLGPTGECSAGPGGFRRRWIPGCGLRSESSHVSELSGYETAV
jgi:hypothetical protein